MRKTALRVIHLGSTLLLSAVCCLAAGQVASPTPTATWPTNWPKGIAPSVVLDAQASPSTPVAEVETLYADLADSYGVISSIDSGCSQLTKGRTEAASLRGLLSSVMLDVAWALFECRMLHNPTAEAVAR